AEHARCQKAVGVGELRLSADRAGARVDRIVDEHHPALVRITRFIGKLYFHGVGNIAGRTALSQLILTGIFQIETFRAFEVEPDWIEGYDTRELCGVGDDRIAHAD